MHRRRLSKVWRACAAGLCGLLALVGAPAGCPPEDYATLLPTTVEEIEFIRTNAALSASVKRERLAELGLGPLEINAILRDERLGNQLGGELRTAFDKITGGSLSTLTPDEVQVYGDEAADVDDALNLALTDVEAQAIVDTFRLNNLATVTQLGAFLDDPLNAALIPSDVPDGALQSLFIDFDPQRLVDRLP
ncbi:hypothetical protein RAS1_39440 [Phycisphaerae bacterium RAS1]|nr:hypothetical protein RAS1_39440 [Phycisphaerae bacterium RAS1]